MVIPWCDTLRKIPRSQGWEQKYLRLLGCLTFNEHCISYDFLSYYRVMCNSFQTMAEWLDSFRGVLLTSNQFTSTSIQFSRTANSKHISVTAMSNTPTMSRYIHADKKRYHRNVKFFKFLPLYYGCTGCLVYKPRTKFLFPKVIINFFFFFPEKNAFHFFKWEIKMLRFKHPGLPYIMLPIIHSDN